MNANGFSLVYHGCDARTGEQILSGKEHVRSSSNEYDWLGNGAYFWENSPTRALQWAKLLQAKPQLSSGYPIKDAFVVGAILRFERCLDLTEAYCLDLLKEAYGEFKISVENAGMYLPQNEKGYVGDEDRVKRYLDCAVIEFFHMCRVQKGRPAFDVVRGAFPEGGELYPGGKNLFKNAHTVLCSKS